MRGPESGRRERPDARERLATRRRALRSVASTITRGAENYDRSRHLARLIPAGPEEIADESPAGRQAILNKLLRALRAERNRGRSGHWTYDLNRHLALSQAYVAESRKAGGHRFRLPPG